MWSDGRLQALDDGSRGVASQVLLGLRLFLVAIRVMGANLDHQCQSLFTTSPVLLSFSRWTSARVLSYHDPNLYCYYTGVFRKRSATPPHF